MTLRPRLLYVVFVNIDGGADALKEAAKHPWTAPKDAQPDDVALFYLAGSSGITAIGRVASSASSGVPDDWTTSERGFFARYRDIESLPRPVGLREIRAEFPTWGRWNNLRGVRVHIVPVDRRESFAGMIAGRNPSSCRLLSPWLPAESPQLSLDDEQHETRPLVTVRRRLRDSEFGRRVRKASGGRCGACSSGTDYEELKILEAAHIRSVQHDGRDRLSNALALCPNHHALFDEGMWSLDDKKIIFREDLPEEIRRTFARHIKCQWDLGIEELEWHRKNVFEADAG